jgi:hypothetical protein
MTDEKFVFSVRKFATASGFSRRRMLRAARMRGSGPRVSLRCEFLSSEIRRNRVALNWSERRPACVLVVAWRMLVQVINSRLWNAQYYQKAHQSITVKITNITKPNDAAKTASRLNFRIRLWYSAAQPISPPLTEVPCAASTTDLADVDQNHELKTRRK